MAFSFRQLALQKFKANADTGSGSLPPGVTRIRGNLCNVHGRYGPCDGASEKSPSRLNYNKPEKTKKPKAGKGGKAPKAAAVPLAEANAAAIDNLVKAGNLNKEDANNLSALSNGDQNVDASKLVEQGLAEIGNDGKPRLTAAGRSTISSGKGKNPDPTKARDIISRATDAVAKRRDAVATSIQKKNDAANTAAQKKAQSAADRAAKLAERRAAASSKASGKSGAQAAAPKPPAEAKPVKPTAAEAKTAYRSSIADQMANNDEGLAPYGSKVLLAFADGTPIPDDTANSRQVFADMGLTEGDPPRLTSEGKAAVAGYNSGNYRAAVDAINAAVEKAKTARANDKAHSPISAGDTEVSVTKAIETTRIPKRWLSITTTAHKDREGEHVSVKGIESEVNRGPSGPLRYWHIRGFDLGSCDFSAQIGEQGEFLMESGTFKSDEAAIAGAKMADAGWQMSPGFDVHSETEPGVFTGVALFERSTTPPNRSMNGGTVFRVVY